MAFAEDLDAFLPDFAVTGTIGSTAVSGIFDNGHATALDLVAGSKPTFLCKVADLPTITLGTTTVVISSTTYTIVESHPDGQGMTTLILEGGAT